MSRRLNTKYSSFINEMLFINPSLHSIISEMAKTNAVASLLKMLSESDDHYPNISTINFISMTDTLNMLKYPRHGGVVKPREQFQKEGQTEMRIGRMVRRIINDVDKSKFKMEFEGKVNFQKMEYTSFDISRIVFSGSISGIEFAQKLTDEDSFWFLVKSGDNKVGTSVVISFNGNKIVANVLDYSEESYRIMWDKNIDYLTVDISNCGIEGVQDVKIEFENTFDGKTINEIGDSEIEKFVNELMAFIKMNKAPENASIEVVKGLDIKHWYDTDNYQSKAGQLGGSCMAHKECQGYFDLYTENPHHVSLLILKSESGKLIGRALLWTLENIPGANSGYFMDRVYCSTEFDEKIFTKYAMDNGYYYRNNSNNNNIKYYFNGEEMSRLPLAVELHNYQFEYYPYLDTLCYLDLDVGVISNEWSGEYNRDRELRDTEGRWIEWEGYEDED